MSILSQAAEFFAAAPRWVLPVVGLAAFIGIGFRFAVVKARKARKAKGSGHEHAVLAWCADHGHAYAIHDTGWQCVVCGNFVARHESELYGPP